MHFTNASYFLRMLYAPPPFLAHLYTFLYTNVYPDIIANLKILILQNAWNPACQ